MLRRTFVMALRRSTRTSSYTAAATVQEPKIVTKRGTKRIADDLPSTKPDKKKKASVPSNDVKEKPVEKFDTPITPVRKKKAVPNKLPPSTPTPSLIGVIRAPYSTGDIDDATPPPKDRPVEPNVTNATLITPGGTQSVAYSNGTSNESPTKTNMPPPTDTTGTLLETACAHLIKVDPRIKSVIEQFPCTIFSPEGLAEQIDPFRSLSSGIMGQQVSGAAAKSIKNKFVALFNEYPTQVATFPTPKQVIATDITRLRTAGLSQRKAEYIQGLAQKFVDKELTTEMLMEAGNDEIMEKLIAVRGLGKWSVEMFICFGLKRMDILSTGDLGVQRGMAHFFGRDIQKLKAKGSKDKWKYMSEQDMLDKSAPFAPYRSLFMWYMWRIEDVNVDVMQ